MSELKKIRTNNLKIEKNVISFDDFLLQISNISHVSIEPIPKRKFNFGSIILLIVGIILSQLKGVLLGLGIVLILVAIVYVLWLCSENSSGDARYLYIWMNSGNNYYFYCEKMAFLKDVMRVIEYCINNNYTQEIRINLHDCNMDNSPIIIGENNEVH